MNTEHTPLIRLQAAQREYDFSCAMCAHWDNEDDGETSYTCCREMEDARRALSAARVAYRKAGGSAVGVSAVRRAEGRA